MPKIKTKRKQKISSTTINFIILFLMIVILGVGLYFFYYFYLQIKSEEIETLADSRAHLTVQSVVKDLDIGNLVENGFYELKQHGIMEYGEQLKGVPTNQQQPLAPDNARIINPGMGDELILMWEKPEPALFKKVVVYRSEAPGKIGQIIAKDQGATGYYIDTSIKDNIAYYYTIRAVNDGYESGNTAQLKGIATDFTPPFPPKNVEVSDTEESALLISWSDPEDKDFAYCRVYRSQVRGAAGELLADKITEGEYIDKNIADGMDYYYMITAVDASGNESSSALSAPPAGNSIPFGSEIDETDQSPQ
ncbi:hypothetical protein KKC88_03325 [Patescibacteria group bacterium]|nr:hypothetical protein [Patescibacteria group bacterium]MBU1673014.1 hypothetical protein [Patescibacteria group bacterium]MBU1964173.1 hypothetical protein [Patescibacteria group bacterium]